jgi:DsbC/DsbD-like thiol-disulfide interchange protein
MTATLHLILVSAVAVAAGPSLAARSQWTASESSQVRLLVSGTEAGRIVGGLEMLLEPGWHTYWRNPGETGIPPTFDFAGSENVSRVEVLYPAPERYDDGASVSLVYHDEVVFPLAVTPADSSRPVRLEISASFGVCREICIPTQAGVELTLPPSPAGDPLSEARVAQYRPRVPSAPEPGRFDIEAVKLEGNAVLIDVRAPDSAYADLFTEPPPGWYLGQATLLSRGGGLSRYRLPLDGKPADAQAKGQRFRFVAVAGSAAIEKVVEIH